MEVNPPRLPRVLTSVGASLDLASGPEIEHMILDGTLLAGQRDRLSIEGSKLIDIDLTSRAIKQFSLEDVVIYRSPLFGLSVDRSLWRRVMLSTVQAVGLVASASTLEDVLIEDSKLDHANFRFATFKHVVFRRCSLIGVDFAGVAMAGVSFDGCEFDDTTFDRASMSKVTFPSSRFGTLYGISGLRGATVSQSQLFELAPQLARDLGVIVE